MTAAGEQVSARVQAFLGIWEPRARRHARLAKLVTTLLPAMVAGVVVYDIASWSPMALMLAIGAALPVLGVGALVAARILDIERRAISQRFLAEFPVDHADYGVALGLLGELVNSRLAPQLLKRLPGGAAAAKAGQAAISAATAAWWQKTAQVFGWSGKSKKLHDLIAAENVLQTSGLTAPAIDYEPHALPAAKPAKCAQKSAVPKVTGDGLKTKPRNPAKTAPTPTPTYIPLDPYRPDEMHAATPARKAGVKP